jgi:FkbM family methyltransferase
MIPVGRYRNRGIKLAKVLLRPRWWRALRLGVAPSLELDPVTFAFAHRTVIDVGAGRGQFALFAQARFPNAEIFAIEPGRASYDILTRVHASSPSVHPLHVAAAATTGEATLHVTADADSSSTLPLEQQDHLFPGTHEVRTESVRTEPLDALLPGTWQRPALLKIDVQGGELNVLRGGERTLANVDEVFVEVSYVALYRGQPRADEVVDYLAQRGFEVAAEYPSGRDQAGRLLQADLRFIRSGPP